jgi:hypothetical protein
MSDYIPNPPNPDRDPRNYDRYYEASSGRGLTLLIGILVAIGLVAGLMYFAGNRGERTEQAQAPISRPVDSLGNPSANSPGNPPTASKPAVPPADIGKASPIPPRE